MPRIDPLELLGCLECLLAPNGGIKSEKEVGRVSSLMERFSKKLVSKSVYLLILKATETNLLSMFMEYGGWHLIHAWLEHGLEEKNWPLLNQILEVLIICPIDIDRLKSNSLPRQVKYLSKATGVPIDIRDLASIIVRNWLIVVKAATQAEAESQKPDDVSISAESASQASENVTFVNNAKDDATTSNKNPRTGNKRQVAEKNDSKRLQVGADKSKKAKINMNSNVRTAKALNLQSCKKPKEEPLVSNDEFDDENDSDYTPSEDEPRRKINRVVHPIEKKKLEKFHTTKKSECTKKQKPKNPVEEQVVINENSEAPFAKPVGSFKLNIIKKESGDYSSKLSLSSSKRKSSEVMDAVKRMKEEALNDVKSVPKKNDLEKSIERTKNSAQGVTLKNPDKNDLFSKSDTVSAVKPNSDDIKNKTQKKLTDVSKQPVSISVEKRVADTKPSTVKTYNSKRRLTGLEEPNNLIPPKPSARKLSTSILEGKKTDISAHKSKLPQLSNVNEKKVKSPTQMSPLSNVNEKKVKSPTQNSENAEVKSPSTKPFIQECGGFIDAMVSAAHTLKGQQRKRKKPGKDDSIDETKEQSGEDLVVDSKPKIKFYKDTMESESSDENGEGQELDIKLPTGTLEMPEFDHMKKKTRGILKAFGCTTKFSIKKAVKWKNDDELEAVQLFEVDVTERINVAKTFWDMQLLERSNEREALIKARQCGSEEYQNSSWPALIPIDVEPPSTSPGANSTERDAHILRIKSIPEVMYFSKEIIPDSPIEPPEYEMFSAAVPPVIPLDDVTGSSESVNDFSDKKWPSPKLSATDITENLTSTNTGINAMPHNSAQMCNQFPNFSQMTPNPYAAINPSIMPNWNMPQVQSPMMQIPITSEMSPFIMPQTVLPNPQMQYQNTFLPTNNIYVNNMPNVHTAVQNWMPYHNIPSDNNNQPSMDEWNSQSSGVSPPRNLQEWLNEPKTNPKFKNSRNDSNRSGGGYSRFSSRDDRRPSRGGFSNNRNNRDHDRRDSWRNSGSDRNRGGPPRGPGGSHGGSSNKHPVCRMFIKQGECTRHGCKFYHPK